MNIDHSTAKSIEHSYQNTAKHATATSIILARAISQLLSNLIKRLTASGAIKDKESHLVEVKIDNKTVYKGETGQKPKINNLSAEQVLMLESALGQGKLKDLQISIDNEPVYYQKNGAVEVNKLQTSLESTTSAQQAGVMENTTSANPQKSEASASGIAQAASGSKAQSFTPAGTELSSSSTEPLRESITSKSEQRMSLTSNVRGLAGVVAAHKVLTSLNLDSHEDQNYLLEKQGKSLTITAKDGRGQIASEQYGQVAGALSSKDLILLSNLSRAVQKDLTPAPRLENLIAIKLLAAGDFSPQEAKTISSQVSALSQTVSTNPIELTFRSQIAEILESSADVSEKADASTRKDVVSANNGKQQKASDLEIE